jgi:hypothetical protein
MLSVFDDMDEDELQMAWMREIKESKSLLTEVQTLVADRSQKLKEGEDAAKVSAISRRKLKTLQDQILKLSQLLKKLAPVLTKTEAGKRGEEINKLSREVDSLEMTIRKECRPPPPVPGASGSPASASGKGMPVNVEAVTPGPRETNRTTGLNNPELVGLQSQMLREQDSQLDQLSSHIQRLSAISNAVNEEITVQNQMLDELGSNMDISSGKLKSSGKTVQSIEDDSMCVVC